MADVSNLVSGAQEGAGAPAPQASGAAQPGLDPSAMDLMKKFLSSPQQHIQAPPIRQPGLGKRIGENVGFAALNMFVPFLGGAVQRAVKQDRESQINGALNTLQAIDHELEMAQYISGGDTKKRDDYLNKSPRLQAIFADKKIRKQLQKVFGTDLLNPEKQNTVWHEAIKRHVELKKGSEAIKMLHSKVQEAQQPQGQGQPQQEGQGGPPQDIAKTVQGLPMKADMPDPKKLDELQLALSRQKQIDRERYDIKQGTVGDTLGKWYAFDKDHPDKPAIPITDKQGQQVGAPNTAGLRSEVNIGKVWFAGGKPSGVHIKDPKTGMVHPGIPGDPGWNDAATAHLLKANQDWALAQAAQDKRAGIRAAAYNKFRVSPVLAKKDIPELGLKRGELGMASYFDISQHPDWFAPAAGGASAMAKEQVFQDIYFNMQNVREAAGNLKTGFSMGQRAKLLVASGTTDPEHMISALITSGALGKLEEDQVNYLTAIASLQENAMAMRTVQGLGQGSDMTRKAILRVVPGPGSPNVAIINRQIDLLQGSLSRLEKGVPKVLDKEIEKDKDKNIEDKLNKVLDQLEGKKDEKN